MEKAIYFDMDGTIASLYEVDGWLDKLQAHDDTPYLEARVMLNMSLLARLLNKLQKQGYYIGIVSWLSKCPTTEYDEKVICAKRIWLKKHLSSVRFDEVTIVAHGTPKCAVVNKPNGILFDDEAQNRTAWKGVSYNEKNILKILKNLVKNS